MITYPCEIRRDQWKYETDQLYIKSLTTNVELSRRITSLDKNNETIVRLLKMSTVKPKKVDLTVEEMKLFKNQNL